MIKQYCDRCGCELGSAGRYETGAADAILDRIAVRTRRWENQFELTEIDLCVDCSILLDKFLRMEVIP